MRLLTGVFILSFALLSCSDDDKIPSKVIPQKEMQTILWDLLLADRYTSQYISRDTTRVLKIENLKLYDQVFQIHKITKAQFIESFDYYLQRPDLTKVMFDSLSAGANSRRGEVYLSTPVK
ncbi:MAG TPA: DUF4296 domain-containing protein [Flavitalea sp.]|nr:DUF4296 domain-containing protein [Flavitalea sp.]